MVLFLTKKNENKFKGFAGWLYDFLNFKSLLAEGILRILYIISAIFITLYSLVMLFFQPIFALLMLTVGNVVMRLLYEFMLVLLIICKNTSEINKRLGGTNTSSANFVDIKDIKLPEKAPKAAPVKTENTATEASPADDTLIKPSNGTAFCPGCGREVEKDSAFCSSCGAKLK